jgi:hypothetical protein
MAQTPANLTENALTQGGVRHRCTRGGRADDRGEVLFPWQLTPNG